METATCAHNTCHCTRPYDKASQATGTRYVDPNGKFCSRRCEERADGGPGDDGCGCGHVQCSVADEAGIPEMQ